MLGLSALPGCKNLGFSKTAIWVSQCLFSGFPTNQALNPSDNQVLD